MTPSQYKKELRRARQFHVQRTDSTCELCRQTSPPVLFLALYFIDRDPANLSPENIALFCEPCASQFRRLNPEGLNIESGIFAFAMNRGLYRGKINANYPTEQTKPPYVKSKRAIRRGARKGKRRTATSPA
jgi:hypothetical protein